VRRKEGGFPGNNYSRVLDTAGHARLYRHLIASVMRMEIVCGKGVDSAPLRLAARLGIHIHDYVRNSEKSLAASDAVVPHCGLTSTTE
jgi:hypothetical protein